MRQIDLASTSLRDLNAALQGAAEGSDDAWTIVNPRGRHAIAVGMTNPVEVTIAGHAGYYAAGMNQRAIVTIDGNAGPGVAENMMSGRVHVKGNASMAAGATGHGGLLVIDGDAGARCGISMKGIDIVVRGSVGHMSGFMAQSGNLVVCGDAGEALGDSLYEARVFVRGTVKSLGADCEKKEMTVADRDLLQSLLERAGMSDVPVGAFTLYGSARRLYHFHVDNASAY
ncbi:protein glxC [Gluconacetobacter tumulisoli]|uniref:Protein glxC n=1 Tax=Gluconacetobacter tumulisoli TaxID=1286189 RepID=A0A7W4K7P6_9PROT|nr:protein glxC [Gluconacetobacter tumulisoli]